MKKFILIDGSSYIFRAFFAIQGLRTSSGLPTNAVYGFINMLMKVLYSRKPDLIAIVFDTPAPSFREEIYPEYKKNREHPPEELIIQIPYIHRVLDGFKIKKLLKDGIEADDIIATVSTIAAEKNFFVEIISGDKDLMQLVSENIVLYDPMKDILYDEKNVFNKFEVLPSQIVDFLALMGDSSDNIPGVSGIGKKTAALLLKKFRNLDNIYNSIDEIKEIKRKEALLREKKNAYLSRKLVKLKKDVQINFEFSEFEVSSPDIEKLGELFKKLEFHNLIKKFELTKQTQFESKIKTEIVNSEKKLRLTLDLLEKSELVFIHHTFEYLNGFGITFCGNENLAYHVPLSANWNNQLDKTLYILRPFLGHPNIFKVVHDSKSFFKTMKKFGITVSGIIFDTHIASYLLNPDDQHDLPQIVSKYLSEQIEIAKDDISLEKLSSFSGECSSLIKRLYSVLNEKMKELGLMELFSGVELPLSSILASMEEYGVLVDDEKLTLMSKELRADLLAKEDEIFRIAGEKFNINSPKQLSQILFNKLGLPIIKKTKTGASTDESVLMKLSSHPICSLILEYRGLEKLRSTYVDGLLPQINPATKRIHTTFNQTVTATGRLSSSNPNLQNIPVSYKTKYDIRSIFTVPDGFLFCSADYSQVELRLLADMSADSELIRAFLNNEDVHSSTARLIFDKKDITPEERAIAKTINFGVMYGQTAFGLSEMLGISRAEAKKFIDMYFKLYSGVTKFFNELIKSARNLGFAKTKLGRIRFVNDINSKNKTLRELAERIAINTPIQGSAADMIKVAMVNISRKLLEGNFKTKLVLQVHDELVFEVPIEEKPKVENLVKEEMESAFKLKVPLRVDIKWGKNWSGSKTN